MVPVFTTTVTKKLVLKYVMENINQQKRNIYLQEIITIGKIDKLWNKALELFFDSPFTSKGIQAICSN